MQLSQLEKVFGTLPMSFCRSHSDIVAGIVEGYRRLVKSDDVDVSVEGERSWSLPLNCGCGNVVVMCGSKRSLERDKVVTLYQVAVHVQVAFDWSASIAVLPQLERIHR